MNDRPVLNLVKALTVMFLIASGGMPSDAAGKPRAVKNIIFMIGDGMGFNQVVAAGLYDKGATGTQLFEKFPARYAMSTYPIGGDYDPALAWSNFNYVLGGYTDSGQAATCMSTGRKSYNGAIGLIGLSQADAVRGTHAIEFAEGRGMATGVVTTNFISDATPAGFVAHNVYRDNTSSIGREMFCDSDVDVIMGAGHPGYNDNNQPLSPLNYNYVGGQTVWNGLAAGTLSVKDADHDGVANDQWKLIETRAQFEDLATTTTPPRRVCGMARVLRGLQWFRSDSRGTDPALYREDPPYSVSLNTGVPSLATMSRGALNVLSRDPDGFFVMIEGGSIDWACHNLQKGRLIEEVLEFTRAIDAVVDWVNTHSNWDETVVIVTADHDNGHIWGPGSGPAFNPLVSNGVGKAPGMTYYGTYHTNALVPLYAKGPESVMGMLRERADQNDPVRGKYLDSAELGQMLVGVIHGFLLPVEMSRFVAE